MSESPLRRAIQGLKPYAHALDLEAVKRKYGLDRVVKLASNENPLGPPPLAVDAVQRAARVMSRYPDPANAGLRGAVAGRLGLDPDLVVAGNGSDDLIDLLVRVLVEPGEQHALTHDPCFDLYVIQCQVAGAACRQVPLKDLELDLAAMAAAVDEQTALIFLTNPMNPTGLALPARDVAAFARDLPDSAFLILDQAYMDFAEPRGEYDILSLLPELPNCGAMFTFSKAWGLAGVRLGFGVFPAWLADGLRRAQIPFNVNALAAEAGIAALTDEAHYTSTLELTKRERARLVAELTSLRCDPLPSQANFILIRPPKDAGDVFQGLLRRGVLVRPLASAGLPHCLRVSVGLKEENDLFLRALAEILSS